MLFPPAERTARGRRSPTLKCGSCARLCLAQGTFTKSSSTCTVSNSKPLALCTVPKMYSGVTRERTVRWRLGGERKGRGRAKRAPPAAFLTLPGASFHRPSLPAWGGGGATGNDSQGSSKFSAHGGVPQNHVPEPAPPSLQTEQRRNLQGAELLAHSHAQGTPFHGLGATAELTAPKEERQLGSPSPQAPRERP